MLAEPLAHCYQNPSYDAFEHLCWVAFPDGPKGQMMAMLTAYLDESYNQKTTTDPNPPLVYTVGCWLSTVEKWRVFGKEWKSALRSRGLADFHMNKFESRIGEYEGWSELARHAFLKRLKQVIRKNTVYGVSVSVNCKDYDELAVPQIKKLWGKNYYGFDVRVIMLFLSQWADENNYNGQIHYVFAHLTKQGGELDRIFDDCLSSRRTREQFRLGSGWTRKFARDEVRLQAADYIAYELNKRCLNHVRGGKQFVRGSLDIFQLDPSRFAPLYMGKPELVKLFKSYHQGIAAILGDKTARFRP